MTAQPHLSDLGTSGVQTPVAKSSPGQFGLDDNVYQRLLQQRIIFLGSEVRD